MSLSIAPKPGFPWRLIAWGKPNSPQRDLCALCHGRVGNVPLILWKDDGSAAKFCDPCVDKWFGLAEWRAQAMTRADAARQKAVKP
jgi:hypothetical protein